ncbi:MAG: Branched-chain amino acid transport ATP-binding protein LivG [Anaerolineae bacterium]|jgi:branched-chain amino acid transport system ATP-binding protein|nr:MAG: Branched-chain amino acid transport ATP-binding protein LivG [Anaerolineae bacterium]
MEAIIRTEKLTRQFGGLVAVNQVDFKITKGEIRGLIGPNGSGKTTLINLLTGVYEPSAGRIFFNNKDITAWPPNRIAQEGLMRTFQIPRLFGSMSLLENMLIPRFADFSLDYWFHRRNAIQRANELLEMCGLAHLKNQSAKTLSGGQKALLQMARCFMVDHIQAFLLDEPFAGVNIVVKETIMDFIRQMRAQGITFLLVSHEMTSIRQMCTQVTVLAEGRIIAEGSMDKIASDPQVIEAYLGGQS